MKTTKSKIFMVSLLPRLYSFAHSFALCFSWGGPALSSHPNSPKAFILTVSPARMLLSGLSTSSTLPSFLSFLIAVHLALVSLQAFHTLKHFLDSCSVHFQSSSIKCSSPEHRCGLFCLLPREAPSTQ